MREKDVRLADREPMSAGVRESGVDPTDERAARSLRIEVLCLRAVLKAVF